METTDQFLRVSPQNCALLLIDYQGAMYNTIESGNRTEIHNGVIALAKAAKILNIPTILTSIWEEGNGPFTKEVTDLFSSYDVIERDEASFDALENTKVLSELNKANCENLVIAGLWTSICMGFSALHALNEGFNVYGVFDAAGDVSVDAHYYGAQRMMQAGVVPVTWMAMVSEWMHDWGNPKARELKREVYARFDPLLGMSA